MSTQHDASTTPRPIVLSHDVDSIIVESTLSCLAEMLADGATIEDAAQDAAEFLADQIASFRPVGVDTYADELDPTPMHQWQVTEGVSASEQYERVMQVVRDLENGAA